MAPAHLMAPARRSSSRRRSSPRTAGASARARGSTRLASRIAAKRVYEPPVAADGTRVLTMRYWPRGIRKEKVDVWLRELAPVVPLLRAYLDGAITWAQFRPRYQAGLRRPEAQAALAEVRALAAQGPITLLCGCADPARCHRTLLRASARLRPRMTRALLALVALVLTAASAHAEHEVYYRYTVIGFVRDASGTPQRDQGLEVIRDKTGFSYLARTDENGMFLFITRLGDESAGETLTLRYGAARVQLTARFDPANHTDERGTRVDLEAGRFIERPAWFRSTLTQFLGSAQR